jgi:hypothetical protein
VDERDVADVQELVHNPRNAVTDGVHLVTTADGARRVRKRLRPPASDDAPGGPWAASEDPRHWNYWRREALAYADPALRESLAGTGLAMPDAEVVESPGGVTLWLEHVDGRPGTEFDLADHAATCRALGRWQSAGPFERPWTSRRFLREYSSARPVDWSPLDDDAAWAQPRVRRCWPASLRSGWRDLVGHSEALLVMAESLPRVRSHLDAWVANEIRRPDGDVVLVDWAFTGDGCVGEDVGNHVPDACFDLFFPADRLDELEQTCVEAYLDGLRDGGWPGDPAEAVRGVRASAVKYTWLLPALLARAEAEEHRAYGRVVDGDDLFTSAGLVLSRLVDWGRLALDD